MIDVKVNKNHQVEHIHCEGGPVELAAEVGLIVGGMYAEVSALNPVAGKILKKLLQATLLDESPTWDLPAGHTASEESAVIAMPRLRRDDPSV